MWVALILSGTVCVRCEAATPPIRPGKVEAFQVPSRHEGRQRRVWVYTPPGDISIGTDLGLVLAFDGEEYLTRIALPHILDSLLADGSTPPQLALLVDDSTSTARLNDLANRAWFVDFVGNELVPWVRQHWKVTRDPARTIITGSSAGGLAAAYIALRRPDLFGNVLSQSAALWRGSEASNGPPYEWLTARAARWPRRRVRFWLEVGSTETRGALNGRAPSILAANRAFRDTLRAKGYDVTYIEVANGVHGVETWGPRLPAGIAGLAPAHK